MKKILSVLNEVVHATVSPFSNCDLLSVINCNGADLSFNYRMKDLAKLIAAASFIGNNPTDLEKQL